MRLAQLQKLEIATKLIHHKMRISIISNVTGINPKTLRTLYREIHGRSPAAGQIPSTSGILSTRLMQATASAFATLYISMSGSKNFDKVNLATLVSAYDLYLELCRGSSHLCPGTPIINITQAWVIARDISIEAACFRYCRRCRIQYLLANDSRLPPTCPLCALKKRKSRKR